MLSSFGCSILNFNTWNWNRLELCTQNWLFSLLNWSSSITVQYYIIYLELPNTGFFKFQTQKTRFWRLVWKKEHRSGFCRLGHFGRSGMEKNVSKALNKLSKPFGSVLAGILKTFWSGNNRSGVLSQAKSIDFGFGVEISTIPRSRGSRYIIYSISRDLCGIPFGFYNL